MKCIIFVKRIIVARTLAYILNSLKALDFWKCEFLVGFHSGLRNMSRSKVNSIVEKFQAGEVLPHHYWLRCNSMVATNNPVSQMLQRFNKSSHYMLITWNIEFLFNNLFSFLRKLFRYNCQIYTEIPSLSLSLDACHPHQFFVLPFLAGCRKCNMTKIKRNKDFFI